MSKYNPLIAEVNKRYHFNLIQTKENEFEYSFTVSDPNLRFLIQTIKIVAVCYEHMGTFLADLKYDYTHPMGQNGYYFGYMKLMSDGSTDFKLHNQ